jgi:FkbM family methyltransferase
LDNANYSPKLIPYIVSSGALDDAPFVLIDVGCGMGIDSAWRAFEPSLLVHGVDPQQDEVERLAREEANPKVHYDAMLVGLPDESDYHEARRNTPNAPYFDPLQRSSGFAATARERDQGRDSLPELNSWQAHPLASKKVGLSEFIRAQALVTVDFIKIDTDGGDYEVLLSAEDSIDEFDILGFQVETPYNAAPDEYAHSFPTVDSFLRRHGFLLYTMTVNRYSRAVLPSQFQYQVLAQTTSGQVMWGDLVYMRDAGSPAYRDVWDRDLDRMKLLKLACLYELFELPDCAVELLLLHREKLGDVIDVQHALDLLTPRLEGQEVSYEEYVSAFKTDPYRFYPPENVAGQAVAPLPEIAARRFRGLLKGRQRD